MKSVKQIGYKLIVVTCVILMYFTFIGSTPVYADSKVDTGFYYYGTTSGSYSASKGISLSSVVDAFETIMDYILGLATMGFRVVLVGWTAWFEWFLTKIVEMASGEEVDIDQLSTSNITGSDQWITLEAIFFNRVRLFDINFFDFSKRTDVDALGQYIEDDSVTAEGTATGESGETSNVTEDTDDDDSLIMVLKRAVAGWYYTFRLISIMIMLIILVYLGIKLAIQTVAAEKALYKRMLVDWLVGMILIFTIHYIMIITININEMLVEQIENWSNGVTGLEIWEYGLEERATETVSNSEIETTLYAEVKTRAYDAKMSVGFTGMVMYMVLVYYAWKFSYVYIKRYLTIAVLVIIAPFVADSYAFNKIKSGKSQVFSKWLKEFIFMVILQTVHALVYVIFVQTALEMSLSSIGSIIFVFILMNFMCKAEGIIRGIFGLKTDLMGSVTDGGLKDLVNSAKTAAMGIGVGKAAASYTKGVAKIATKPITAFGTAKFGNAMIKKAKRLDEEENNKSDDEKDDEVKKGDAIQQKKHAAFAKGLKDGTIDVEQIQAAVDEVNQKKASLKIGDVVKDQAGNDVVVDQDYIDAFNESANAATSDANYILALSQDQDEIERLSKEFKRMSSLKARMGEFAKTQYNDITNPNHYVKRVIKKDKDGKIVKDENGKPIVESYELIDTKRVHDNKYIGKKVDSAGIRLSEKLKADKLLGLDANSKAALKQQTSLITSEVKGLFGIVAGIPLLVAEPSVGAAFLYVGASNTGKVFSGKGRKKIKTMSHIRQKYDGKYTLVGFEGSSAEAIANGAQYAAEVEYDKQKDLDNQEKNGVNVRTPIKKVQYRERLSERHQKITKYATLVTNIAGIGTSAAILSTAKVDGVEGSLNVGAKAATATTIKKAYMYSAAVVKDAASASVVAPVVGVTAGTVLTRHLMGNAFANFYAAGLEAEEVEGKAQAKDWENDLKNFNQKNYEAKVLEMLTSDYEKAEEYKQKAKAERHASDFVTMYTAMTAQQASQVNEMSDEEVQRENNYEDPIEIETTADGKMQLAGDSERKLISDAIVETAQKCGIMDISEFDMTASHMKQVKKNIETKLKLSGAAGNVDKNAEVMIEQLESKIKAEQSKLAKTGTKASEEKMTDEAIVAVMQEKGISDPSKVKDEDVQAKYTKIFTERIAGAKPSDSSQDVVGKLNGGKPSEPTSSTSSLEAAKRASSQGVNESDGRKAITEGTSGIVKQTENAGSQVVSSLDMQRIASNIHTSNEAGSTLSTQSVQARKSIMSAKAKKGISKETSAALRETIKRKQAMELDSMILEHQDNLDNIAGVNTTSDVIANENGGVNGQSKASQLPGFEEFTANISKAQESAVNTAQKSKSKDLDSSIQLLQIATQLHQDKLQLQELSTSKGKEKVRKQMALDHSDQELLNDYYKTLGTSKDGTKKYTGSQERDSSRRVEAIGTRTQTRGSTTAKADLHTKTMDEMLKTLKSNNI